ncbi:MAG: deoxyuridine 5'-triphosphate nucleotidohydrolase [Gramella sp.]|nr:deoxyuridine 5'-triphosphate nucleotidohydrolase [Christiangramia sp.]
MVKKLIVLFIIALFVVSCGTTRRAKIATEDAEAVSVIQKHYQNEADFKTVMGKLRAVYQDDERTQSVNLSFRMEKDKAIWMSASILGFPVAKAYITPERVSYYEKVTQTYFDGDFSLVSDFVGTPLDFEKLQNLLIGQAIYDLRNEKYDFSATGRGFQFASAEGEFIKKMFLLNPSNFKASAQQLTQEKDNRGVTITYSDYQSTDGFIFPEEIKIIANEGNSSTNIELTYRSLSFNEEVTFPFEIPSGYEEISLK